MIGRGQKNPETALKAGVGLGQPWDSVSCREGTLFLDLDESELISLSIRL